MPSETGFYLTMYNVKSKVIIRTGNKTNNQTKKIINHFKDYSSYFISGQNKG